MMLAVKAAVHPDQRQLFKQVGTGYEPVEMRPTLHELFAQPQSWFGVSLEKALDEIYEGSVPRNGRCNCALDALKELSAVSELIVGIRGDPEDIDAFQQRRIEFSDNQRKGVQSSLRAVRDRISFPYAGISALAYILSGYLETREAGDKRSAKSIVYRCGQLQSIVRTLTDSPIAYAVIDGSIQNWSALATTLSTTFPHLGTLPSSASQKLCKRFVMQHLPAALTPTRFIEQQELTPLAATMLRTAAKLAGTCDGPDVSVVVYGYDYLRADMLALMQAGGSRKDVFFASTPAEARAQLRRPKVRPLVILLSNRDFPTTFESLQHVGLPDTAPIIAGGVNRGIFDRAVNDDRVRVFLSGKQIA